MTASISNDVRPVPAHTADATTKAPHKPSSDAGKTVRPESSTTVSLSAAALAALAKEAAETPADTAREAQGNDRQAQRLIAKQAAAKAARE